MFSINKFFRKKENKFDHIISLGYNCEVTFRFVRYFTFEESGLFNWSYSRSVRDLINALNNFESLGTNDFRLPDPLWECNSTHIRFHGKANMKFYINNTATEEIINADRIDLIERISHLKEKFLRILRDDSSKLYIYKIRDDEYNSKNMLDLENALKQLGGNNFKLLFVCQGSVKTQSLPVEGFITRYVKEFADDNCVTSKKYFNNGWDKIYDEFYCIKPKNYKKTKKYKFETKDRSKHKDKLVSVLIPAYNHEKYVQETIKSIIAQTYQNVELIVIDDGSKDSTWTKIQEMKEECEKRFKNVYFETKENEGICKTLNKLIERAKGEYIYIIASDDMAKPEAIETHIKFLNKHKDYILCVGNCELIDSDGKICYWNKNLELIYEKEKAKYKDFGSRQKSARKDVNFNSSYFGTYPSLVKGNYIPNGYLVRKSVYEKTGLYTNEAPLEDYYMNLQLSKFGKMKYLEKVLFSYRWHDTNTIKNIDKMRKWTKITQDYDQSLLTNSEWLDKHYKDLLPEVKDYIHYGVIYKKFGLKNVFEFQKFKKDDTTTKIIKIVTVPFLVISKGNKKTSVKFFHK